MYSDSDEEVLKLHEEVGDGGAVLDDDDGVMSANDVDFKDMLRYSAISQITNLLRSRRFSDLFATMAAFNDQPPKNAIVQDDAEYGFVKDSASMVLRIENEKTKALKFTRDHYAARFPELAMLVPDALAYVKVVKLISNELNLEDVVEEMSELMTSHTVVAIIGAASTTKGRALGEAELRRVMEGAEEVIQLENGKQVVLEYIQTRMPLIAPNMCAFIGSGLVSQMFTLVGSIERIAQSDPQEIAKLGSKRGNDSGIAVITHGFLANCDLIGCHTPELRPKATRLVAAKLVNLARIDFGRRAADDSQGKSTRDFVRRQMIQWTDPLIKRGSAHNTYERRDRVRPEKEDKDDKRRVGQKFRRH